MTCQNNKARLKAIKLLSPEELKRTPVVMRSNKKKHEIYINLVAHSYCSSDAMQTEQAENVVQNAVLL